MNHDADPDLLRAWGEGDHEAYATLVARHHGLVRAACLRQAPAEFIDDCVQAVFLVLFRRPSAAAKAPIFSAWLLKVSNNVCHTARRTEVRRQATERVAAQQQSQEDHESPGHSEALAHLDECLQLLPEAQRTAVSLQYLTGRSGSEVASTMGINRPNAYRLAERGLATLRELLVRRRVTLGLSALVGLLGTQAHAAALPASAATVIQLTTGIPSTGATALATGTLKAMTITALTTPLLAAAGLILAIGAATVVISAEPAPESPAAVTAPAAAGFIAYDLATPGAHNPCYDQKGLWPEDVKKTAYYKEAWEPARLLVWTSKKEGNLKPEDVNDLANWQEYPALSGGRYGGARPATAPSDANTDVVFPDSPQNEHGRRTVIQAPLPARHLTIGRNVWLDFWHRPQVTGNLWVDGTWLNPAMNLAGGKNNFVRFSGERFQTKELRVNKQAGAAVEFLGSRIQCEDWLEINSGVMIAGPGCTLAMGNRHQNIIAPKGTLVLMSGATFKTYQEKDFAYDLDVFGKVWAGTPERPLTSDAIFSLNGKSKTKAIHPFGNPGDRSFRLQPTGAIAVCSADPAKARLVFKLDAASKHKLIDLKLAGTLSFDGVLFEDVELGGIQLRDADVRKAWKNVSFGQRNAVKSDELVAYNAGSDLGGVHDEQKTAREQLTEAAEAAAKGK